MSDGDIHVFEVLFTPPRTPPTLIKESWGNGEKFRFDFEIVTMRCSLNIVTVTMRYSLKIVTVTMRYFLNEVTVTMSVPVLTLVISLDY